MSVSVPLRKKRKEGFGAGLKGGGCKDGGGALVLSLELPGRGREEGLGETGVLC